jgi:hypothetical protein
MLATSSGVTAVSRGAPGTVGRVSADALQIGTGRYASASHFEQDVMNQPIPMIVSPNTSRLQRFIVRPAIRSGSDQESP